MIGVSGAITIVIAILAYLKKSDVRITGTDWLFLTLAITALPCWYLTTNPLWAVVILTTVDVLGFGPTIRKAYAKPFEEKLLFYLIFVPRNLIAIAALEHYSLTTVLFPAITATTCMMLILVVISRRQKMKYNT